MAAGVTGTTVGQKVKIRIIRSYAHAKALIIIPAVSGTLHGSPDQIPSNPLVGLLGCVMVELRARTHLSTSSPLLFSMLKSLITYHPLPNEEEPFTTVEIFENHPSDRLGILRRQLLALGVCFCLLLISITLNIRLLLHNAMPNKDVEGLPSSKFGWKHHSYLAVAIKADLN